MTWHLWHSNTDRRLQTLQRVYFDFPLMITWLMLSTRIFSKTFRGYCNLEIFFRPDEESTVRTISLIKASIGTFLPSIFLCSSHALTAAAFKLHAKKSHHHLFERIRALYVATN